MKRLIYIFMVIALVCMVITMTSVSVFAEETEGEEIVGGEVDVAPEEGDEAVDGEGTTNDEENNNAENAPAGFPFEEQFNAIKAKLFGWLEQVWAFIQSSETYKTIFGVVAAIVAFLLLPVFFGLVFIVYFIIAVIYLSIGAMTAIAAALSSVVAMIVSVVMQFLPF